MTYLREMERARRDVRELRGLLATHTAEPIELTDRELALAIGLAATAHRALLAAMASRHTEGPQA